MKGHSGFTLIELMVVISLIGIVTASGVVSYSSYNKRQSLQMGTADVVNLLTFAKSKAISQVKPSECGEGTLEGYQVSYTPLGSEYALQVLCMGTSYPIKKQQLPQGVSFMTGSANIVRFVVSSGTSSTPGKIMLQNGTDTKTIDISTTGTITAK